MFRNAMFLLIPRGLFIRSEEMEELENYMTEIQCTISLRSLITTSPPPESNVKKSWLPINPELEIASSPKVAKS